MVVVKEEHTIYCEPGCNGERRWLSGKGEGMGARTEGIVPTCTLSYLGSTLDCDGCHFSE